MQRAPATAPAPSAEQAPRSIEGPCWVCGSSAVFERGVGSVLSSFTCPHCRATLRYQGQAAALVRCYSKNKASSLAELVREPTFASLRIYEPGDRGALHRYLGTLPGHVRSIFEPGIPGGTVVDGARCEDLMALTFPTEEFDLVITSDVMEHVRHPYVAFAEIHRVLRSGGLHVFTVPVRYPMREKTAERVDVSGPEDVFLVKPAYHNTHLVYNDYGKDMLSRLDEIGFETEVVRFDSPDAEASTQLTFCSRKL